MTKWPLVATLSLALVGFSQTPSPKKANSAPKTSLVQRTDTDAEILQLKLRMQLLEETIQHDIPILNDRTWDLNERLKRLENQSPVGPSQKAMFRFAAELNDVDARVAQLERPETEDEAK